MTLSTQGLLALPDAAVTAAVTSQFTAQLKCSPSVKGYFFDATDSVNPQDPTFVDNLAVAFVCSAIARSSLYGFAATVNMAAADSYWQTNLADTSAPAVAEGQALYGWAFPDYCKADGVSFRDYMNDDPTGWAQKLTQYVTTAPFIDTMVNKIFADPGWLDQLNLILYKIQRLDPNSATDAVAVWQKAYPDKGIVQNWENRNFIPEANFTEIPDQFLAAVNLQIAQVYTYTQQPADTGAGGWSQPVYGWLVAYQFLGVQPPYPDMDWNQNSAPRRLGFLSGAGPANLGQSSPLSCFVAGTLVHLADGRRVSIESIGKGDRVLTQDGGVAFQSRETVVIEVAEDTPIFGFDDGTSKTDAFFSAGHLFWTAEGWKALDPHTALVENPDRHIGQLKEGDRVFRLESTDPLSYEEVVIAGFTKGVLPAGGKLFGLHLLDGARSYHADGYLAGMNYPVITKKRLVDGCRRLTGSELKILEQHLRPVMPLLNVVAGPFVESALHEVLAAARDQGQKVGQPQ